MTTILQLHRRVPRAMIPSSTGRCGCAVHVSAGCGCAGCGCAGCGCAGCGCKQNAYVREEKPKARSMSTAQTLSVLSGERNLCGEWLCGGGGDGDCAVVCVVAAIRRNRSENRPPCPETMSATVTMLPVDGYAIMTDMLIITHVRDDGEHQEDGVACSKICVATKYVWRQNMYGDGDVHVRRVRWHTCAMCIDDIAQRLL